MKLVVLIKHISPAKIGKNDTTSEKIGNAMQNIFTRKSWSPYAVGAAIGVLSWFTFLSADKPLGITTALESTMAIAKSELMPHMKETN